MNRRQRKNFREWKKYLKALKNRKLDTRIEKHWHLIDVVRGCEIYFDPKTLREPLGNGKYELPDRPYIRVERWGNGNLTFDRMNRYEWDSLKTPPVKHEYIRTPFGIFCGDENLKKILEGSKKL
jgi:hypothetical protein